MTIVKNILPIKEPLVPDPDGVRTAFYTTQSYVNKSISVWLNGLRLDPNVEEAFIEEGSNLILMKEPPEVGDSLYVQYDPT